MGFFGGGGSAGGIGGSTGATDNAILRADGTGAATLQNSDLNVDDATTTTQNNVAITNQHSGQTNSALVLTPKGTGAFIVGPKPDGTATGGNARGANAICIQTDHVGLATGVASGLRSIAIGNGVRATGNYSMAIGETSQASAGVSVALGASSNATQASAVAVGDSASASSDGAVAIGKSASMSLRSGFATTCFSSVYFGGQTTNNTPTVLGLDTVSGQRLTIAANTAVMADLFIIARRSDTVDKWFSGRRMVAIRRNNANGTAIIGSVQTIGADQTEGSPTWSVAITADDTNEALQVQVTGETGETIQWRVLALYRVV